MVLLEPKLSGVRASNVVKRFGFDGVYRVDPNGYASRIWVF